MSHIIAYEIPVTLVYDISAKETKTTYNPKLK